MSLAVCPLPACSPWWPSLLACLRGLQQSWALPHGHSPSRCSRGPEAARVQPARAPAHSCHPSAERAPTRGTQQHNFTILPCLGERLKHLSRSLERPFANIFCLQLTCDLPYLVTGENKTSWHGLCLSALDLVAA